MTDPLRPRIASLDTESVRRELLEANEAIDALGVVLSRRECVGVELAAGEDRWQVLDEVLAEARRVLASTGFHDRERASQFLCECSTCTKRRRPGLELGDAP